MNPLKVIVVDDNHTNRLLPGLFLRPLGHEVQECDSAAQALAWLADHACDLVLLDISMPTVSGLQLCQQLRQLAHLQHLKIVAYTAHAMPEEVQLLESSGFDKVLLKPIRSQELLDVITI
jgi:CheY-like chemotaxis protein